MSRSLLRWASVVLLGTLLGVVSCSEQPKKTEPAKKVEPPKVEMPAEPAKPATPTPKEEAKPAVETPQPAAPTPKPETPKSAEAPKPSAPPTKEEPAKPAEAPKPAAPPVKIDPPKIEAPKPSAPPTKVEAKPATPSPMPETPKPSETPKPATPPTKVEAKPATPAPKAEAPKKDAGAKTDTPKPAVVVAAAAVTTSVVKSDKPLFGPLDWNQWGGNAQRNNTPPGKNIPSEWEPGSFDDQGNWDKSSAQNIKWVAALGSQSYGNPIVANGKVYVGTNNGHGYISRYPATVDLGCLVCFSEKDGSFLWQHSSEKLPTGRVHDWPLQGICCSPYIEGERLWFVTSRGEVVCADTEGFYDNENDGPYKDEKYTEKTEADTIWVFDMMKELGVSQHNMCSCSITATGDTLWVCTSNGVDETHINLPAPQAPSFIAVDKNTGKVIWTNDAPGNNILHGQWSSPAWAVLGGKPQVIFAGGDAWIYSFLGEPTPGKPTMLWEFDANPKESVYILGGRGTRNEIIGTPVVYDNKVYLAVGQDPEHGEGIGHLWCIDPTKAGDVSSQLAVELNNRNNKLPKRRLKAIEDETKEIAIPNPNSAVVWHYSEYDLNGNGKVEFEESMHRTIATVVIKDDLLYVPDFSGLVHCVDAKTGKPYWTHDLFAATWGSAMVVDGKVFVGDEEGKLTIFKHGKTKEIIAEIDMINSIYSSPMVANNVLYIANKTHLFAIEVKE